MILTKKCEIRRAVADELDEGLSHRLAKRRVRCDDVGDREEREQHSWFMLSVVEEESN